MQGLKMNNGFFFIKVIDDIVNKLMILSTSVAENFQKHTVNHQRLGLRGDGR